MITLILPGNLPCLTRLQDMPFILVALWAMSLGEFLGGLASLGESMDDREDVIYPRVGVLLDLTVMKI